MDGKIKSLLAWETETRLHFTHKIVPSGLIWKVSIFWPKDKRITNQLNEMITLDNMSCSYHTRTLSLTSSELPFSSRIWISQNNLNPCSQQYINQLITVDRRWFNGLSWSSSSCIIKVSSMWNKSVNLFTQKPDNNTVEIVNMLNS